MKFVTIYKRPSVHAQDGDNINNYVEVCGDPGSAVASQRLISENGRTTDSERAKVKAAIEAC